MSGKSTGTAIGLLGGTFNPVHNGHLYLAGEAGAQFHLQKVLFIPSLVPPHRDLHAAELLPAQERYQMCVLATSGHLNFEVSRMEVDRKGPSYTYDTVRLLKTKNPEDRYSFITGADSLAQYSWHRFPDLLELLDTLLIADRHEKAENVQKKLREEFPLFSGKFQRIYMSPLPVSSTEIRKRIRNGENIQSLVPEPVLQYIQQRRLYQEVARP